MGFGLHAASAPAFVRVFESMLGWLDKAAAHAAGRGYAPDDFLALRLAPDMLPFVKQVQIATDTAKGCIARLAGREVPSWPDDETTLDALRARLRKAIDFVQSVPADALDGSEGREIALPTRGGEPRRFSGQDYLTQFVLPNLYFHATTAYALLRAGGVPLGKMDFLGEPKG